MRSPAGASSWRMAVVSLLLDQWRPFCGEELFRLPDPDAPFLMCEGSMTVWLHTAGSGPVAGPAAAVCIREPHESSWHWDGKGTWWRS